jgi:NAD(P)-dependent dehydrogenase (short-subunit alcohol dehydrogenase family)
LPRALAMDLSKKGIRVNSVCQSLTRTGMTEDMMVDKDLLGLPSGFRSGASASLGKLQP